MDRFRKLEGVLNQSFEDHKLSNKEKYELRELVESCSLEK